MASCRRRSGQTKALADQHDPFSPQTPSSSLKGQILGGLEYRVPYRVVTADTYTHVLVEGAEVDHDRLLVLRAA